MEKKVPERKVSLREEDIIYVYDKRINKCIKGDCEGTVKYGLVLRVSVSEEETLNCFECNKCHMKYTPYPNYVRLTKTDMLHIYNKDEVDARDAKRAEDAIKQAAREKKAHDRGGFKKGFNKNFDKKPYDKKPYEKKSYGEKRPFENKPFDRKPYDDRKPYEKKPYGQKSFEGRSYNNGNSENGNFERRPYGQKSYDKPFERKPYEKKYDSNSYGKYSQDKPTYGQKSSYEKFSNTNGGYKKPFCSDKPYEKRNDRPRNNGVFIVTGGYKKNYNDKFKKAEAKEAEE